MLTVLAGLTLRLVHTTVAGVTLWMSCPCHVQTQKRTWRCDETDPTKFKFAADNSSCSAFAWLGKDKVWPFLLSFQSIPTGRESKEVQLSSRKWSALPSADSSYSTCLYCFLLLFNSPGEYQSSRTCHAPQWTQTDQVWSPSLITHSSYCSCWQSCPRLSQAERLSTYFLILLWSWFKKQKTKKTMKPGSEAGTLSTRPAAS